MSSAAPYRQQQQSEAEILRRLDGAERVILLPFARVVAFAPGDTPEDPAFVWIEWAPGQLERPLPGSALWRAVLVDFLRGEPSGDPAEPLLERMILESLRRFPDLDTWRRWASTPPPPRPASGAPRKPSRRPGRGARASGRWLGPW